MNEIIQLTPGRPLSYSLSSLSLDILSISPFLYFYFSISHSLSLFSTLSLFILDEKHSHLESSNQHIRDLRIAVEFKSLAKQAPGGVYLMPNLDDIRIFYGVIFVRRGLYKNGIFRFTMTLPPNYNSLGSTPQIVFTPPIFNPLVDKRVIFFFRKLFYYYFRNS